MFCTSLLSKLSTLPNLYSRFNYQVWRCFLGASQASLQRFSASHYARAIF
ncbi:hypothetical protein RO3G_00041 [Rhizopus delemar RA 99-880]|uniref:Uncharacterized protein n=1 Tax=Rhizopus delemar (strain RA 99-880 / ATCC MYA-4621 / FGSC 9543 / NRRL 43880) TaxID=246409 RepID=I1BGK7_RHIO9|nr:hypothetical protein RO3G_00041 [Rhizopus delemar RA 99-880]|eukprot:EIE75337.1 hypothetical protein RO3G_00041 [Rhizopus delemar RA 99-880]